MLLVVVVALGVWALLLLPLAVATGRSFEAGSDRDPAPGPEREPEFALDSIFRDA